MIYPINHLPEVIPVGVQTEQGVEVIGFDLKPWLDALPDMDFSVWHTRPGEKEAYPAKDQMMIGTVLYWHPDSYDTAIAGDGKVEIAGVGDNQRKLSGFVKTSIRATSLGATKEPGENIPPWYEAVLQAVQDVKADVDVGESGLFLVRAVGPEEYAPTVDRTIDEIRAAVAEGKTVFAIDKEGIVYAYAGDYGESANDEPCPKFFSHIKYSYGKLQYRGAEIRADNRLNRIGNAGMKTPAPYALNIAGETYDGSKTVSVLSAPADTASPAYLRWNGAGYVPATVDSVKAELGGGGGTVEVDATLTKANAAADAKVVGDRFTSLSEEIDEINDLLGIGTDGETTTEGKQLFDKDNAKLLTMYLGATEGKVTASGGGSHQTVFVSIDGSKDTAVTVHRELLFARFVVATYTSANPAVGEVGVSVVSDSTSQIKTLTVPIDSTIKTVGIFFFNKGAGDDETKITEFLDSLMVQYGSVYTGYEPYGATSQPSGGSGIGKIAEIIAPVKRYGVKWSVADVDDMGARCFDAEGLTASIGVGATNGASDFDTIYPWSDMKRCNIRTNAAGANIVTYEGDEGFALDGSNGDVFVRIPRFCVEKFVKDGYEYRVVSRSSGNLHPAFVENGKELDAIYIGAFEGKISSGKLRSIAGVIPTNNEEPPVFLTAAQANGTCYTLYDMRCIDALWTLMAVEYGRRNSNRIIGYGWADFYQPVISGCVSVMSETGVNRIVTSAISNTTAKYMPVGSNITVCKGDQYTILTQAKLLSLVTKNGQTIFTFDGEPINTDTTCFIGSAPATTNFTETSSGALSWHTGRSEFIAGSNVQNPIRYRWIENPVGNVWHYTPDMTVKDLQMYLCQDMTKYGFGKVDDGYVPVCDVLPDTNRDNGSKSDVTGYNYWITSLQRDDFASGISFGKAYDKNLVSTQAFGAYLYTDSGNGDLFTNVNGGGFDHLWRCNMLTNRAYTHIDQKWYLYGARLIYKRII